MIEPEYTARYIIIYSIIRVCIAEYKHNIYYIPTYYTLLT